MLHLCLPITLAAIAAAAPPIPVILDTDLGDDIDDTWALCMLLGMPQFDVKLITVASDNTPIKARLVAKMLERLGRTDIPLGIGPKTSDSAINQAAWLGDYALAGYGGVVHEDGVQALIDTIHASPARMTLCVIGPQTNIAAALARDPSIAEKARVVSMAGSVHIGYMGQAGRMPEWNVKKDIAAARAVIAAPWEVTYAPLDICGTLKLSGRRYHKVARSDHPRARVVIENYEAWSNRPRYPVDESSILFDTVAVYLLGHEDWTEVETIKLVVDDAGNTVPDDVHGRPVRCALRWKKQRSFEKLLVKSITRGH